MDKLVPYTFYGEVKGAHDGDNLTLDVDLGFGTIRKNQSVRLAGCNAIELKEPGGKEARENLLARLPVGTVVLVKSVHYDKYANRIDADIWEIDHAGNALPGGNLVQNLAAEGWVSLWDGHGTKPVPVWPRPA